MVRVRFRIGWLLCAMFASFTAILGGDGFTWIPSEGKQTLGKNSKVRVLPVVHTSIPKKTADKSRFRRRYEIDLEKYNISNRGTNPVETSRGINLALQDAKKRGKNYILFPHGVYLISEKDPIILNLKNTIVDLNGATLQLNPSGIRGSQIAIIAHGTEHFRLTNGTMRGDLFTHQYPERLPKRGGGATLRFKSGSHIEVDHMLFTEATGFCVTSSKGLDRVIETGYRPVSANQLESGGFSKRGKKTANENHCRTIKPYNLTTDNGKRVRPIVGEFEFGYIFGYGSFQSIFDRNYTALFYDKKMNFLKKSKCIQYKKHSIPKRAVHIHLEFNQPNAKNASEGMVGSITNLAAPVDVHFHHNHIYNNSSLGFAFCGGQRWLMEYNTFERNGGGAPPHYGIDFEDGWDLMQDVVFRNNRFADNHQGDLVVCAGSELLFDGNVFQKTAFVWGRTHNYTFKNNRFLGGRAGFMTRTGIVTIENNAFHLCDISIKYEAGRWDGITDHDVAVKTPSVTLRHNDLSRVSLSGTYLKLERCKLRDVTLNAGKETQVVELRKCRLGDTKLVFKKQGPRVRVNVRECEGTIEEIGSGLTRKLK